MSQFRPVVKFKRIPGAEDLPLPAYQSKGAAGLDLPLFVTEDEYYRSDRARDQRFPFMLKYRSIGLLGGGDRLLCSTGFEIEVAPGFEAQVRPRSGLANKHGVTVLNSPGTIDCDYRGELKVLLVNLSDRPVALTHGDRIAQLVIAPVSQAQVVEAVELTETARGAGGFGSTGQ